MSDIDIDGASREVVGYLVLKKIHISNANTLSSPITYGFPAISGFLGAFHAMSRKVMESDIQGFHLGGILLACHDCQPHVYRTTKYSNYTFNQSRNPIKRNGKTASIVEEGKCHLTMSFVVEIWGEDEPSDDEQRGLISLLGELIQQHRVAGGSVEPFGENNPVSFCPIEDIDTLSLSLIPAFVLMDATSDFIEILEEAKSSDPNITDLDVLIDVCAIHHIPEPQLKNGEPTGLTAWSTQSKKTGRGWLVPIPFGFHAISDAYKPGEMQHARSAEYASQYVESVYGLGKWVYPLRLTDDFEEAFWRYHHETESGLYRITQSVTDS